MNEVVILEVVILLFNIGNSASLPGTNTVGKTYHSYWLSKQEVGHAWRHALTQQSRRRKEKLSGEIPICYMLFRLTCKMHFAFLP